MTNKPSDNPSTAGNQQETEFLLEIGHELMEAFAMIPFETDGQRNSERARNVILGITSKISLRIRGSSETKRDAPYVHVNNAEMI